MGCKIWQQYFTPPKSPIVRGVKYDCHIMHPLKDQTEGVKYGRGVKYGVTPERPRLKRPCLKRPCPKHPTCFVDPVYSTCQYNKCHIWEI